jgi:hypothetical protein
MRAPRLLEKWPLLTVLASIITAAVIAVVVIAPQVAVSSQVYFLPLEEVLTPTSIVVEARIQSQTINRTPDDISAIYDIEVVSVLQGTLPHSPSKAIASQVIPVIRNPKTGEVEMTFSPILPGSGIELSLLPDQRYILIAPQAPSLPASALIIQRAEPMERAPALKTLIAGFRTK